MVSLDKELKSSYYNPNWFVFAAYGKLLARGLTYRSVHDFSTSSLCTKFLCCFETVAAGRPDFFLKHVDLKQIHTYEYIHIRAFHWRLTHGLLYGNKMRYRFGIKENSTVGSRYNDILRHPKKYRYNEIIVIMRIICIEYNTLFYYLKKLVIFD